MTIFNKSLWKNDDGERIKRLKIRTKLSKGDLCASGYYFLVTLKDLPEWVGSGVRQNIRSEESEAVKAWVVTDVVGALLLGDCFPLIWRVVIGMAPCELEFVWSW